MNGIIRYKKTISLFLLLLLELEIFIPQHAYALTSGPAQPEMKGFTPVGSSDLVDLFSGDFTYSIPLLEVGGYPVSLSYHAGANMDDEASWVGSGWSLTPGSLNRQLRGLPDDFDGTDSLLREMNMKDHITKGLNAVVKLDLVGIPVSQLGKVKRVKKRLRKKIAKLSNPSLSVGVQYDNYRGIGTEIGANTGIELGQIVAGEKTSALGLSFDLKSSSLNGATFSPNINFSTLKHEGRYTQSLGRSIGFSYNSRAGLEGMTLGTSFNAGAALKDARVPLSTLRASDHSGSFISFAGNTYTPGLEMPSSITSYSGSVDFGGVIAIALGSLGVTGFYTQQRLAQKSRRLPAYGFLYSAKGKDKAEAVLDFNREKDIPYDKSVNYLPVPVPANDLFLATGQGAVGQYTLGSGSAGVFFDHHTKSRDNNLTFGLEGGAGTFFDAGADVYHQQTVTSTGKWSSKNDFLEVGDFQSSNTSDPAFEPVYFKKVGELTPADDPYLDRLFNEEPVAVDLPDASDHSRQGIGALAEFNAKYQENNVITSPLKRDKRAARNENFSYLTASEAAHHALDTMLKSYPYNQLVLSGCGDPGVTAIARTADYRKGHHISEVTLTGTDGKRTVYGIPVYNTNQEEVSFSIGADLSKRDRGLIGYRSGIDDSRANANGRDRYYSREVTPPYATSYLLTGILSPDYVDVTKDGITDDDRGTAVKFNYYRLPYDFGWRAPYDSANYNEGFLSDDRDDKAGYVYGRKEVWYWHSIESKTMVAQFILEDRDDGLGVTGAGGGKDTNAKLKRLKEIRLYSKADLEKHGGDASQAVPIKVVHFEYDYSILNGLPNSLNGGGKLTLKKVYFTFGYNNKGRLHPYEFEYNTDAADLYMPRQYDRWGNYKEAGANPAGLNNSEFPYTLQDSALCAAYASKWQLKTVHLPSGGSINVTYESDDYAYVQDKRASQMCFVKGIGSIGSSSGLINTKAIYVDLPVPVSDERELRYRYFQDMQYLYYKFFIDLDHLGHKEFVPGYIKLSPEDITLIDATTARISIPERKEGINPIAFAAWQFLRTDLPKYAFPGYDNYEDSGSNFLKAVKSLLPALLNIKELITGFSPRAKHKHYGDNVDLSKSWVRLCAPTFKKLGGGLRVGEIAVSDNWAAMSGAAGAKTADYVQSYDYTTTIKDDKGNDLQISSGVASYEPLLGGDENPFREPVTFKKDVILGLDYYRYIERPLGESFFPAPEVGYSKVTVTNIGAGEATGIPQTGTVVNEFYTARDYPVKLQELGIEKIKPKTSALLKLIGARITDNVGLSQGYSVEVNDMHGKPKAVQVFNRSGQKIASTEYFYRSRNNAAERKELDNTAKLIYPDGTVDDGTIGEDVQVFTDMREQNSRNSGQSGMVSGGTELFFIFPFPFGFPGLGANNEYRSYHAASTIKLIHKFGILEKVRKMENGSSITTENVARDAVTGEVLLTKTQNEFDDPVYTFSYPAHWAYDGMGPAYKNSGAYLEDLSTGPQGEVTNAAYSNVLAAGDEVIDLNTAARYWVIFTNGELRLIDEEGQLQQVNHIAAKVLRSGRRNMTAASMAMLSSLKDPIVGNSLDIGALTGILDAKATVYSGEWSMPVKVPCEEQACPDGCILSPDGSYCYRYDTIPAIPPTTSDFATVCARANEVYGTFGTYIYMAGYNRNGTGTSSAIDLSNAFWKNIGSSLTAGPLNRCGVWDCDSSGPFNTWVGFTTAITVPVTKTYFIGIGGDNEAEIIINQDTVVQQDDIAIADQYGSVDRTFKIWHIYPVTLQTGQNIIQLKGKNFELDASFGAEIYDNTEAEIRSATSYDGLNVLFSSKDFQGRSFTPGGYTGYGCPADYTLDSTGGGNTLAASPTTYFCTGMVVCQHNKGIGGVINPYATGILGNWKPQKAYVYHTDRYQSPADSTVMGGTDIRRSGAYASFNPFWLYDPSRQHFEANPLNDSNWILGNEITYYNAKGAEIENKDALNRYSAALYSYLESLPVAVASNARYRETAFDGFEDYDFTLSCGNPDSCNGGHFNFKRALNGTTVTVTGAEAHTGWYSLQVGAPIALTRSVYDGQQSALYDIDGNGRYILESNELSKGFSPVPGQKYMLSCWVKDGNPRTATTNISIKINDGANLVSALDKWPVVEGWKRVEVPFSLPVLATAFSLQVDPQGGTVYLDDIRIHPYDGQMKSFVYDPASLRLMAELDENNFATFYEYDDEGILVRVKKETERGIMTIKETRSSYARHTP